MMQGIDKCERWLIPDHYNIQTTIFNLYSKPSGSQLNAHVAQFQYNVSTRNRDMMVVICWNIPGSLSGGAHSVQGRCIGTRHRSLETPARPFAEALLRNGTHNKEQQDKPVKRFERPSRNIHLA